MEVRRKEFNINLVLFIYLSFFSYIYANCKTIFRIIHMTLRELNIRSHKDRNQRSDTITNQFFMQFELMNCLFANQSLLQYIIFLYHISQWQNPPLSRYFTKFPTSFLFRKSIFIII